MKLIQTSEYVAPGHPDKVADTISSLILDAHLRQDPNVRYALEVQLKGEHCTIAGELTTRAVIMEDEIAELAREAVAKIGYTAEYQRRFGADNTICADDLKVACHITRQSPDIAQGVDADGWGDQGIFWGMATNERKFGYMPRDYHYARLLGLNLYALARKGMLPIGLDIKTQVETQNGEPTAAIIAAPMLYDAPAKAVRTLAASLLPGIDPERVIVNGTGRYATHGPIADCGTTGRKLAVDFYGGNCRIGGGSPWTKDPSKADLALNIYARFVALRYILANPQWGKVYVGISCCIGRRDIRVTIYDQTGGQLDTRIESRPARELITDLALRKPMYAELCMNGLFTDVDAAVAGIEPLGLGLAE